MIFAMVYVIISVRMKMTKYLMWKLSYSVKIYIFDHVNLILC